MSCADHPQLGAWLIEWPRLGRRLALAGSTFLTALLCAVFVVVHEPFAVTATTVGISLSATVRACVLYPRVFAKHVITTDHVGSDIWVRDKVSFNAQTNLYVPSPCLLGGHPRYLRREVSRDRSLGPPK
jgi:hypothetical protein